MHIDMEVAVGALHAFGQVDVIKMDGVFEIGVGDDVIVQVQAVAFLVLLEDGAKHPAVAVIVRKLRVFELRVQLGSLFEKVAVAPQAAGGCGFGILHRGADEFVIGRIVLLLRV